MARNGVIGRDGGLPWHLPADLKAFKDATMGKPIIMGRKTWSAIGRALPGRLNIVVSRDESLQLPDATVCHTLDEAFAQALASGADEAMVIGGANIYAQALPLADCLILTVVQAEVPGDCYFPEFDESRWQLVERELRAQDQVNAFDLEFRRYERPVSPV